MALMLLRQRDGKTLRGQWYGEFTDNGRRKVVNLNVPLAGTPPASGLVSDPGNQEFEDSRKAAEAALARHADDAGRKGRAENLTERLIESKTGRRVEYATIDALAARWEGLTRSRKLHPRHAAGCRSKFELFAEFIKDRHPKARNLYEVTPPDAAAFMGTLQGEFSSKTIGDFIRLLRAAFDRFLPTGAANPFREIVTNRRGEKDDTGTIHRAPLSPEQITCLLNYARNKDPLLHDLITAGICTGLRRGDLCRMKWSDVDLADGMLDIKTSKTGAEVEIPIFNPLRAVLESRKGNGKAFCFPEAETINRTAPQSLSWRFKVAAARAFAAPAKATTPRAAADVIPAGLAVIDAMPPSDRRERVRDNFTRYMAGKSVRAIEKETGCLRSTISNDLHNIEQATGLSFIRATKPGCIKAEVARLTRQPRESGARAGSVIDWHCLRTSFVTIALSAGVPVELVRRITGHGTVEVVLKHYFRPGREQFKAALLGAMPPVLTGGKPARLRPADVLAALAGKVAAGTATEKEKNKLRALAAKV